MKEFRAWVIRNKESRWVPIGEHENVEDAHAYARRKYRDRLVSVRPIPKRGEAA